MNDGLKMKYFVLNPTKDDAYGKASRDALKTYAKAIREENLGLSHDLELWLIIIEGGRRMLELQERFNAEEVRAAATDGG